jgi:hypothetical protein
MYYEFDRKDQVSSTGSSGEFSLSSAMPFVGFGASAFADNGIFADLYYEVAFSGSDSFEQNVGDGQRATFDVDWDRDEFSLTVGYTMTENFREMKKKRNFQLAPAIPAMGRELGG